LNGPAGRACAPVRVDREATFFLLGGVAFFCGNVG
jgi:hypothetical protein